ncbi:MAG: hypothetical protein O7D29_07180, partial [Gemmatimonadetes bacterium]|nr:hypothetical protein [Gemmatimonadota bacterium]
GDRPPHGLQVVVALEWARLNERLGNRDTAIDAYGLVADMWQHADDLLQSFVSEAREALQRLTGESG